MGKTIGIIIGVIVLVAGAGAGGFYGGTIYQQQQQQNVRTAFLNGRGGAGGGGYGGGGAGGFGGGVFGTVKSVNGNTIQVSTPQNVTTVTLTGATVIQKTVAGAPADITVGEQITVRGQRDSSGNVTAATSVQILPAGTTFGNRGGDNGGGNATQAP